MVNLRKTRQIELTDIHPQHVVCAWLGNSEDVAKKHYLKVTDGHMAAGCLVSACQKAGPKAGLSVTAMPSHAVSAKSQTLENKAYHVMSYHDMPAIGGQVGDEGLRQNGANVCNYSLKTTSEKSVGAQVGAKMSLSQVVALLIERWDELDRHSREEILRKLE